MIIIVVNRRKRKQLLIIHLLLGCALLLEATKVACNSGGRGSLFWTAGQRIDPSTGSAFLWRLTSTDTYSDTVSLMGYANWFPGEPNHGANGDEACVELGNGRSYRWNDRVCSEKLCSVCELDIL